jgi:hypothetical protein
LAEELFRIEFAPAIPVTVNVPQHPGRHLLAIDLVHEHVH